MNLGYAIQVKFRGYLFFIVLASSPMMLVHAETTSSLDQMKSRLSRLLGPQPTQNAIKVDLSSLSQYSLDLSKVQEEPLFSQPNQAKPNVQTQIKNSLSTGRDRQQAKRAVSIEEAVHQALQRRPEIAQSIAQVGVQGTNIDVAKSKLYPQLTGGVNTADLTTGERGRQLVTLEATQLLYDFGKVKTNIHLEEVKLTEEQARVLIEIEDIAHQVSSTIVNIIRYQEVAKIAQQQIDGITYIAEIANLRASAGISSQADPIQAQSSLEEAQANLVVQETMLKQHYQRLRNLLGYEVSQIQWSIPDELVKKADLYEGVDFNRIPSLMLAQAGIEVAKLQKQQSKLTYMPTINIRGTLSQAINGRNPNNNEDNGMYNSIMLEASSNLYQGGAVGAQTRAASYAEEAARARVNTTYLDILDQVRIIQEQIEQKQKQMKILSARKETAIRTKELYQEQYKLGTRTAVDLLNAEQAIHRAGQEIEVARYDIYAAIMQYIQLTGRTSDLYGLHHISIQGFEIQP